MSLQADNGLRAASVPGKIRLFGERQQRIKAPVSLETAPKRWRACHYHDQDLTPSMCAGYLVQLRKGSRQSSTLMSELLVPEGS